MENIYAYINNKPLTSYISLFVVAITSYAASPKFRTASLHWSRKAVQLGNNQFSEPLSTYQWLSARLALETANLLQFTQYSNYLTTSPTKTVVHTEITTQSEESKERIAIEEDISRATWKSTILKNKFKDRASNFLVVFSASKSQRAIKKTIIKGILNKIMMQWITKHYAIILLIIRCEKGIITLT